MQYGGEKILGAIPFFHVYGMTVAMLFSIYTGAELIVTPDPRQTDLVLEILQREKITMYPGIPTMYTAIINHPKVDEADLPLDQGLPLRWNVTAEGNPAPLPSRSQAADWRKDTA